MKLSILICHLKEREELLERLRKVLNRQIIPEEVEVLIETDSGEISTGEKRNKLLKRAKGDYICFIDDDDLVPEYYVEEILKAIKSSTTAPDVIGIKGHYTVGQNKPSLFILSLKYSKWFSKKGIYYRCPEHLNPVKRELALKVGFPKKSYGEDRDYSMALKEHLKSEVFIDRIMYYYLK